MKAYERFISKSQIEELHEQTLRVMQEVGICIENEEARMMLKAKGAKVEGDNVFFTREIVEEALRCTKPEFEFNSPTDCISVGNGSLLFGPASSNVYKKTNNGIEKMSNDDIVTQFKLSETSDVMQMADLNYMADRTKFTEDQKMYSGIAMTLKYSKKFPIMARPNYFGHNPREAGDIYKKGLQIMQEFEEKDSGIVSVASLNTMSPLCIGDQEIEIMKAAAETNQAIWISSCAMPILTAPPTLASVIITGNAEELAALVIAKMFNPDVAFMYGNTSASTNMKTMQISIGSPECALVAYATQGLAELYNLPFRTGGGLSDAKECNVQAGAESMMVLNATIDAEADYIHHACGTIGQFNVVDFRKWLVDEDIIRYGLRMRRGIRCDEETYAFDQFVKMGPHGNLITQRTPKIFKEEFIAPKYLDKQDSGTWVSGGSKEFMHYLDEEVEKRLSTFTMPEIPEYKLKLIEKYIPEEYRNEI